MKTTRHKDAGLGGARRGKILILFAVVLPALFGMLALSLDGGMLQLEYLRCQQAADAAATAAALRLQAGDDPAAVAAQVVQELNGLPDASIMINNPPQSGAYVGREGFVQVQVEQNCPGYFLRAAGFGGPVQVGARAVAGLEASTAASAIVLLDENPPPLTLGGLPVLLPSLTPLLGGLEVLGLGSLRSTGAILVNTRWGGVDEQGEPVNNGLGLGNACSCTPLLPLTHVQAPDIRVVGGVDRADNYRPLYAMDPSPLKANRRPVPDPYRDLPVPTIMSDPTNVATTSYGGVTILNIPLLQPPHVLQPGVYDWITIVSGRVVFQPGIYIIRGSHPVTKIGLNLLTGSIQANGVMFYLTNSPGYSPVSGLPDIDDGENFGPVSLPALLPSALIDTALLNTSFSGLDDPGSPYHGMLVFQRRTDRRPILLVQQALIGSTSISGNVYARSSHVIITANGLYRSAFAVGSLRVATALETRIEPLQFLPPAYDVSLVE